MDIKYGYIVVDKKTMNNVYHFVGYESPPTQYDYDDFAREIVEDPEISLDMNDKIIVEAPPYIVDIMVEEIINQEKLELARLQKLANIQSK